MVSLHPRSVMVSQNSYYCSWSLEGSLQGVLKSLGEAFILLMEAILHQLGYPVNNMINYQPQLVRQFSKPSTHYPRFHFCTTSSFLKLVFVPRPLLEGWIQIPQPDLADQRCCDLPTISTRFNAWSATSEYLLDPRISDGICRLAEVR